jgi:hypothetical protein
MPKITFILYPRPFIYKTVHHSKFTYDKKSKTVHITIIVFLFEELSWTESHCSAHPSYLGNLYYRFCMFSRHLSIDLAA